MQAMRASVSASAPSRAVRVQVLDHAPERTRAGRAFDRRSPAGPAAVAGFGPVGVRAGQLARFLHDERHGLVHLAAIVQPGRRPLAAVGFDLLERHDELRKLGDAVDAGERRLHVQPLVGVLVAQVALVERRGQHDLDAARGNLGVQKRVPALASHHVSFEERPLVAFAGDELLRPHRLEVAHAHEARVAASLAEVPFERHVGHRHGEVAVGEGSSSSRGGVSRKTVVDACALRQKRGHRLVGLDGAHPQILHARQLDVAHDVGHLPAAVRAGAFPLFEPPFAAGVAGSAAGGAGLLIRHGFLPIRRNARQALADALAGA